MINLDELLTLANKATPGPWEEVERYIGMDRRDIYTAITSSKGDVLSEPGCMSEDNIAFICAANPSVVKALIEEIKRLETWRKQSPKEQAEYLSKSIKEYNEKFKRLTEDDPEKARTEAISMLTAAGILDENGNIAEYYR